MSRLSKFKKINYPIFLQGRVNISFSQKNFISNYSMIFSILLFIIIYYMSKYKQTEIGSNPCIELI